jgi:RHS repeat-associated protein
VLDATGTLRARYDYDAWGNRTKLSGDVDADIGFTGHLHHKPTGLILTLCRAYDPRLGRWLSRDPIAERGGINLYGCVGNDPVNLRDPTGEAALPGAIVGALTSIGIQILEHNGNIKCVNWKTVAVDSAMGATGVGLVKNVTKLKSLKRAIDNVEKLESSLKHVGSDAAREYLEKKAKQDAMKATGRAAGLSAGQGLKNSIKENDCECPDNEE